MKVDDWVYLCFVVFAAGVLLAWHRDPANKLNLLDLICKDGKISDHKFMRFGAWCVMTLGFYTMQMHRPELLIWYAPLYGALFVSMAAVDKWQRQQEQK